jgi:hypothetical protein
MTKLIETFGYDIRTNKYTSLYESIFYTSYTFYMVPPLRWMYNMRVAETFRRYTMCVITNKRTKACESVTHLRAFVGYDVILLPSVCGSFITEAFNGLTEGVDNKVTCHYAHNPWFLTKRSKKKVMESIRSCIPLVRIWRETRWNES